MEVRFVGSGDAFGSGGRFQTCIQLRDRQATLLVDCGATSLVALKAQGQDPGAVDAVVITHLHGDHFGGLPFLILDAQFRRRTRPLTVLGPAGTEDRLRRAMDVLYPGSAAVQRRFRLEVGPLDGAGAPGEIGPWTVTGWEVDHASGAPALGVRVGLGGGPAFGYSGDTAWTPALRSVAAGTDVFACEAYTFERKIRYHLAYETLLAHASELETERLVLTHMGPDMLAHLDDSVFATAHDGMVVHL